MGIKILSTGGSGGGGYFSGAGVASGAIDMDSNAITNVSGGTGTGLSVTATTGTPVSASTSGASANPIIYGNASATHTGDLFKLDVNGSEKLSVELDGDVQMATGSNVSLRGGHASSSIDFASGGGITITPANSNTTVAAGTFSILGSAARVNLGSGWQGISTTAVGSSGAMVFNVNSANTERMRLGPDGTLTLTGTMNLPAMTAPGSNPASGAYLYVDSADGDLKVRFANGTVATIATN